MKFEEEPGWKEYWRSGGDINKLKKKKIGHAAKTTILIILAALIIIISIKGFNYQIKNQSKSVYTAPVMTPAKDTSIVRNITGEKAVAGDMKLYMENIKSYIESLNSISSNLNENFYKNESMLNNNIYNQYQNSYKYVLDIPSEMKDYKDVILKELKEIDTIVPIPETSLDILTYNEIIERLNNEKILKYIADFLETNGYYCEYDPDQRHLYWRYIANPQ